MNRNAFVLGAFVLLILAGIGATQLGSGQLPFNSDQSQSPNAPANDSSTDPVPQVEQNKSENSSLNNVADEPTVVAENLEVPWGIEFLPNDDMLVTERPGTLVRIKEGENGYRETYNVEGVEHRGEGGLLGIEVHPNYTQNNWIYLYMTTQEGDMLENRVVRYQLEGNQLSNPKVIIDKLPGAIYHDGGRIEFGPDDKLYITAGDATNEDWAQETDVLAGKILRINPDGSIPKNPFGNEVYSYGHRNPQGLTWANEQLWATEHGDRQHDELNRVVKGANYGWPVIEADQSRENMRNPEVYASGTTWAPTGAEYINGSIFFAGLRGQTLYEAEIQNQEVNRLNQHLEGEYGRLREVELGPDGYLYISTSNRDGRGNPSSRDDRIIRLDTDIF